MPQARTRIRLKVLAALVVFMFAALTTRLWFLQVLAAPEFAHEAQQNRVRLVPTMPFRGEILDRHGTVLVGEQLDARRVRRTARSWATGPTRSCSASRRSCTGRRRRSSGA